MRGHVWGLTTWPTGWQLRLWRVTVLAVKSEHNKHAAQLSIWVRLK